MNVIQTANRCFSEILVGTILLTMLGLIGITKQPLTREASHPVNVFIGAAIPDVQTTIYSAEWCQPCRPYVKAVKTELTADGYQIRNSTDADASSAHIIIDKTEKQFDKLQIEKIPCTIIRRGGVEKKRIYGAATPKELDRLINEVAK